MLAFDSAALLDRFEMEAFVSAIDSGKAWRKAVRRDRDTLVLYQTWLKGMADGSAHATAGRIPGSLPPAGGGAPLNRCLSSVAENA
jgi:hypothetical protein